MRHVPARQRPAAGEHSTLRPAPQAGASSETSARAARVGTRGASLSGRAGTAAKGQKAGRGGGAPRGLRTKSLLARHIVPGEGARDETTSVGLDFSPAVVLEAVGGDEVLDPWHQQPR